MYLEYMTLLVSGHLIEALRILGTQTELPPIKQLCLVPNRIRQHLCWGDHTCPSSSQHRLVEPMSPAPIHIDYTDSLLEEHDIEHILWHLEQRL